MKYKYNADLEIQHIGLGDRLANFFHGAEALILVREEDYKKFPGGEGYVIASFDKNGFCNNASSEHRQDKAWDEFYRIMCEMRKETPDGHVRDDADDYDPDDSISNFIRELNGG